MVNGVPGGMMNTYCWIHGTFTIPSALTGVKGEDVPHPGVAPKSNRQRNEEEPGHVGSVKISRARLAWKCYRPSSIKQSAAEMSV